MTYVMSPTMVSLLIAEEGYRQFPYRDTEGKLTVGIGRNLDDVGISRAEALYLMSGDIALAAAHCDKNFPFWGGLDAVRQDVFVNLWFNMGGKLLGFKNMIAAATSGDWEGAAGELINSTADHEEPARISALANILKSGQVNGFGATPIATS